MSATPYKPAAIRLNDGLWAIQMHEQRNKDINHAQATTLYRLTRVLGCEMEDLLESGEQLANNDNLFRQTFPQTINTKKA